MIRRSVIILVLLGPWNTGGIVKSFLGKKLRLDVDNMVGRDGEGDGIGNATVSVVAVG